MLQKNKLKNDLEESLLTNIFFNINKFKELYSLTYLESIPALKEDLKRLISNKKDYLEKMKKQFFFFEKMNSNLSNNLTNIFEKIELKKKLKNKEKMKNPGRESFIHSMLREQPDFTEFFGKNKKDKNNDEKISEKKISTAQEFRRYLKQMGIANYENSKINFSMAKNDQDINKLDEIPKQFEILYKEKILFKPQPKKKINQIENRDVYFQIQNYFHTR